MITRIQAQKYRCFDQLDVHLSQYNVLAGANGSGKTTLMDILLLFSDMLSSNNLSQAFLETSPLTNALRTQRLRELTYCHMGDYFSFMLEAQLPQNIIADLVSDASERVQANPKRWPHTLRYEIRLQIFNEIELQVTDEYLWLVQENATSEERGLRIDSHAPSSWKSIIAREARGPSGTISLRPEKKGKGFAFRLNPNALALKTLPLDSSLFPAAVWFINMLETGTILYEPDVLKLQQDSQLVSTKTIRPDAGNLPWMVLDLQQKRPERPASFEDWVAHVQTALPYIEKIEAIEREDSFHAYFNVTYKGGFTVPSSGLSAGTLRILALTILPYLSEPPAIVCLEEPENGIHPRGIEAVLQSLGSLYNSQVLLSTHSPIVLAHTPLSSVIVMQSEENGAKKAIAGNKHSHLQNWHSAIDLDLGSLFAAGVLD
ncbi:MAG: methylation-associated defense system AAA family ATPase MAD3 [Ktedonobacteraceae bacterium]